MLLMLALIRPLQLSRCHQDEGFFPCLRHLQSIETSYHCGKPMSGLVSNVWKHGCKAIQRLIFLS